MSTGSHSNEWIVPLTISNCNNNHVLNVKVDTGAQKNLLSYDDYFKLKPRPNMYPSNVRLVSYTKHAIEVFGKTFIRVNFDKNFYLIEFIVVKSNSLPILGLHDANALGLINHINAVGNVKNSFTEEIYKQYPNLFSGLGCLPGLHRIKLKPDAIPVRRPCTKVPFPMKKQLQEKLKQMEKNHIILPVAEPTEWVNSLTLVPKKCDDIRVCLDPRPLNKYIIREHFALPTREELMSQFAGAKWFSKIDANSAFWQVKLDEESSFLTTFSTPFGCYRFLRLPYGICSASEHFHRVLYNLLSGIKGVLTQMDDVVVFGATKEEHDASLHEVLNILGENNLTLNKEKCTFGVQTIKFMGEIVSKDGIYPDPDKIKAIQQLVPPTSKTDLQKFLGMVNYLARFIPGYSDATELLRSLLKKSSVWHWTELHASAWTQLKTMVTKSPVLLFYNPNNDITIAADSSKSALGAVLLQRDENDNVRPVAYASRALTITEQKYAQITKELLAISFACERFHQYIMSKHFTVQTDHKPLISLFSKEFSKCPLRVQRLLLSLQRYDFNAVFVPGKLMYTADLLSRFVNNTNSSDKIKIESILNYHVGAVMTSSFCSMSEKSKSKLCAVTSKDEELSIIKSYVLDGWPKYRNLCHPLAKPYWQYKEEFSFIDGLLFRGTRLVIPKSLRGDYLDRLHFGHLGETKCKARANETIFWPGINHDIINIVSSCHTCAKHRAQNQREPLLPHPEPLFPYQRVGLDLFSCFSQDYLILVDYYSSYPEIVKLTSTKTCAILNALKPIFARWGKPETLISDNAPQLVSDEFDHFCMEWGIDHVPSSPYLPRSNGMAERGVQSAKKLIKKTVETGQDLHQALLVMRSTPLQCGLSPAQLLLGRRLRNNLPIFSSLLDTNSSNYSRNFSEEKKNYKKYYDQHTKQLPELRIGAQVYIYNTSENMWNVSAQVVEQLSSRSYLLKASNGAFYKRNRVHLKPQTFRLESTRNNVVKTPVTKRISSRVKLKPDRLMYYS